MTDVFFIIRHDLAKVSRLRTFLLWKDVRKRAKDSDDKGGGDVAADVDFDDVITSTDLLLSLTDTDILAHKTRRR